MAEITKEQTLMADTQTRALTEAFDWLAPFELDEVRR